MLSNPLDTHQKAVQINLDNTKYGTFAEIGAGQEVARWFFRVGGAAGTIAKSISAYDMTVSDAIYGASGRYVSRQRLETMLDYEYRLDERALADNAARTPGSSSSPIPSPPRATRARRTSTAGWACGFRPARLRAVADHPARQPAGSRDDLAARGDRHPGRQPDPRGALRAPSPSALVRQLLDDLSRERIEVDMIEFSGPAFATSTTA